MTAQETADEVVVVTSRPAPSTKPRLKRQPPYAVILTETRRSTPADTAASRIDFAGWLRGLSRRNRRIAEALAAGHRTTDVARRFKVSPARISQLREEFRASWAAFHDDWRPRFSPASVPIVECLSGSG